MRYIQKSDAEKALLSEYCRNTVSEYYSVEKMTDDYIKAYASLPGFEN